MDRCANAYQYHRDGYNCAQSVVAAFLDQLDLTKEQAMAMAGGFGGGVGGTRSEMCGAVSGAILVLSLLTPHTEGADTVGKKQVYGVAKEFHQRYAEAFGGLTRCGELLKARPAVNEKTQAAARLGITAHCDVMIVTAVEIVETMLAERG